jgi:hypothetical protein
MLQHDLIHRINYLDTHTARKALGTPHFVTKENAITLTGNDQTVVTGWKREPLASQ